MTDTNFHVFKDGFQINLSSSASLTQTNANNQLLFSVPYLLPFSPNHLYTKVALINAQIPVSFYIINANNNFLSTSLGNYYFVLGNYNANTFMTMIKGVLGSSWNITFSQITGKFSLTHTSSDFTLYFNSTCFKILGMIKATNQSSVSRTLNLPNPCNFLGTTKINLFSKSLKTKNLDINSRNSFLSTIPVNSNIYGLIQYNNYNDDGDILETKIVDTIDISITDEDNNPINFNGLDLNFTLRFDVYKKHEDFQRYLSIGGNTP